MFKCASTTVLLILFAVSVRGVVAEDETSIKELRNAVVALSPTIDPREAELLSVTVHTMSRALAREYGVTGDPAVHNFLINTGQRKRGYCAHYARDIGTRLREMNFKTLMLHWGAAYAKTSDESNCLVVTARNQPFREGILLDAWRHGGRLFWSQVEKDREYDVGQRFARIRLGGHRESGTTAWKEDLQETAWLQPRPAPKAASKQKRRKATSSQSAPAIIDRAFARH
jgi:hypothetical protein